MQLLLGLLLLAATTAASSLTLNRRVAQISASPWICHDLLVWSTNALQVNMEEQL